MKWEPQPSQCARATDYRGEPITVRVERKIENSHPRAGSGDCLYVVKFGEVRMLKRKSELELTPLAKAARAMLKDAGLAE